MHFRYGNSKCLNYSKFRLQKLQRKHVFPREVSLAYVKGAVERSLLQKEERRKASSEIVKNVKSLPQGPFLTKKA